MDQLSSYPEYNPSNSHQNHPSVTSPLDYNQSAASSFNLFGTLFFILLSFLIALTIYFLGLITFSDSYSAAGKNSLTIPLAALTAIPITSLAIIKLFGKKMLAAIKVLTSRQKNFSVVFSSVFNSFAIIFLSQIIPITTNPGISIFQIIILSSAFSLFFNLIIYSYSEILKLPSPIFSISPSPISGLPSKFISLLIIDTIILSISPAFLFIIGVLGTGGLLIAFGFFYLPLLPFTILALILFSLLPYEKFAKKQLIYLTRLHIESSIKSSLSTSLIVTAIQLTYGLLDLASPIEDSFSWALFTFVITLILLSITKLIYFLRYKKLAISSSTSA